MWIAYFQSGYPQAIIISTCGIERKNSTVKISLDGEEGQNE
jgi:hypothetical protein